MKGVFSDFLMFLSKGLPIDLHAISLLSMRKNWDAIYSFSFFCLLTSSHPSIERVPPVGGVTESRLSREESRFMCIKRLCWWEEMEKRRERGCEWMREHGQSFNESESEGKLKRKPRDGMPRKWAKQRDVKIDKQRERTNERNKEGDEKHMGMPLHESFISAIELFTKKSAVAGI